MKPRALIVEDDFDERQAYAAQFVDLGFDVAQAGDPQTAVGLIRQSLKEQRPFSIAWVDLNLKSEAGKGVDVVDKLRDLHRKVKVPPPYLLVVSGTFNELKNPAATLGKLFAGFTHKDFLEKDIHPETTCVAAREAIETHFATIQSERPVQSRPYQYRLEGSGHDQFVQVRFGEHEPVQFKALLGHRMLRLLLQHPGRPFHVNELHIHASAPGDTEGPLVSFDDRILETSSGRADSDYLFEDLEPHILAVAKAIRSSHLEVDWTPSTGRGQSWKKAMTWLQHVVDMAQRECELGETRELRELHEIASTTLLQAKRSYRMRDTDASRVRGPINRTLKAIAKVSVLQDLYSHLTTSGVLERSRGGFIWTYNPERDQQTQPSWET